MNALRETVQVQTVDGRRLNPCKLRHALKLQERGDGLLLNGVFIRGATRKPDSLAHERRVSLAVVLAAMAQRPGYSDPSHFTYAHYPIPDLKSEPDFA